MSRQLFNYFLTTAIALTGFVSTGNSTNVLSAQASSPSLSRSSNNLLQTAPQSNKANNLIREIANLEVQRVLLTSRFTTSSTQIVSTDRKLQALRQELSQQQPRKTNHLNLAIANSLKTKVAELEVELATLRAVYTDTNTRIQVMEKDIQNLRKRFTQIQPRNSQIKINRVVSRSLKNKISELKSEHTRLRNIYSEHDVKVAVVNEQIQQLEKRLQTVTKSSR